ncbi:MAG: hypothetical protein RIG62_22770 [Cyclobacteriaceae bacterium]
MGQLLDKTRVIPADIDLIDLFTFIEVENKDMVALKAIALAGNTRKLLLLPAKYRYCTGNCIGGKYR